MSIISTVKIDKNYSIVTDPYNFTLKFENKYTNKKGEESTSRNEWHYPDLGSVLIKYTNEAIKPSKDAEEMVKALGRVNDTIINFINSLK